MAILEITDVSAGYGAGPDILRGLSLEVEEAQSYCIIGPNGAGKSTLLKVIAGLLSRYLIIQRVAAVMTELCVVWVFFSTFRAEYFLSRECNPQYITY